MRGQSVWSWLVNSLAVLVLTGPAYAGAVDASLEKADASISAGDYPAARTSLEALLRQSRAGKRARTEFASLTRLGDIALTTKAYPAAADWYTQALRVAQAHPDLGLIRPEIANRMGNANWISRDVAAATEGFRLGLKLAQDANNTLEMANASYALGTIKSERGELAEGREMLEQAVAAANKMPPDHAAGRYVKIRSLLSLADLELGAGRLEQASCAAELAAQLSRETGLQVEEAQAQVTLGIVFMMQGRPEESRGRFNSAIGYLRTSSDPTGLSDALIGLAQVEVRARNYVAARKLAEEAQIAARKTGFAVVEATALEMLARVDVAMGDEASSLQATQRAVDIYRRENDIPRLAIALVSLGHALKRTDLDKGRRAFREAYELAKDKGQRCPHVKAAVALGNLELPETPTRAEPYFAEALVGAQVASDTCATADAHFGMGLVRLAQDNPAQAERHIKAALRLYENEKRDLQAGDALLALGKVELARGDSGAARGHFLNAADAFGRADAPNKQQSAWNLAAGTEWWREAQQWLAQHAATSAAIATALIAALAAVLWSRRGRTNVPAKAGRGDWFHDAGRDTVFVFVHGILSDSTTCWTAANGTYWPAVVRDDARFDQPDVYLGGYYTSVGSGIFGVDDAAAKLISDLRTTDAQGRASALTRPRIVFVAHSTGGLVVRYLLERHAAQFAGKQVGLVLVASPSRGSDWANRLRMLHRTFGNRMGGQLERDQDLIRDLDQRFADLVRDGGIPQLQGVDLFENHFIIRWLGLFNRSQVVRASDSASYFGAYRIVPDTDHFSIAKPDSAQHASHQYLWEFYSCTLARVGHSPTP